MLLSQQSPLATGCVKAATATPFPARSYGRLRETYYNLGSNCLHVIRDDS